MAKDSPYAISNFYCGFMRINKKTQNIPRNFSVIKPPIACLRALKIIAYAITSNENIKKQIVSRKEENKRRGQPSPTRVSLYLYVTEGFFARNR